MFKWFLGLLAIFVGWCLDWGIDHKIRRVKTWWRMHWYNWRSRSKRWLKHCRRRIRNHKRDGHWLAIGFVAAAVTLHYVRPKLWWRFAMNRRGPQIRRDFVNFLNLGR